MKRFKLWFWIGVGLLALGLGGLAMDHLLQPGFGEDAGSVAFVEGQGLRYEEAKQLYRDAGEALKNHRPEDAIEAYERIKAPYARLRPMILLRQAEAYAQNGQEAKAQENLQAVIAEAGKTPFAWLALYALGQSQVRLKQYEAAQQSFARLVSEAPKSNLGIGSHYYLGELAAQAQDFTKAAQHWRTYLLACPEGTFSTLAAEGLAKLSGQKTAQDYQGMGLAQFYAGHQKTAIKHFQKAPFQKVWLAWGKAEIQSGNSKAGLQLLEKGMLVSEEPEDIQEGITVALKAMPTEAAQKAALLRWLKQNPKRGGDFILWQLQKYATGTERNLYADRLLKTYPQSNWAPETSWQRMWPLYRQGQLNDFLARAQTHLKRYPRSNSAPRVLFWKAKVFLAQGKTEIAQELLRQLMEDYPNQYYAFRAKQLLVSEDAPWATDTDTDYPPAIKPNPDAQARALAKLVSPKAMAPVVAELIRVGSADDVAWLMNVDSAQTDKANPLMSWVYAQQKQYAQSIRTMRDALDGYRKSGKAIRDPQLYQLLYPVVYTEEIAEHATDNRLDPFLVQALMRQESYFNPFAVSSSKAMGLMQLLPSTAQGVAQWEKLPQFQTASLFNPDVNVQLGTRYLRYLMDRFNGNGILAVGGYNGGPGAMSRWVNGSRAVVESDPDLFIESIPYGQTRDYIKEVYAHYWNYRQLYGS